MDRIDVKVLNPEVVKECERMIVVGARLTQRGHAIKTMNDFMDLYEKSYKPETVKAMCSLPHPTIQKLGAINIVVVGASRRFLAQITRHQNEVKFVSASLQYSDYSGVGYDAFTVPYEIMERGQTEINYYLFKCGMQMAEYQKAVERGIGHDSAGYMAPQSLRNILIISATPYQFKHMIKQRTCRRNTKETEYVMLKIWEALYELSPEMFFNAGPFCMNGPCQEGKMCCGNPIKKGLTPTDILKEDFPLLYQEE